MGLERPRPADGERALPSIRYAVRCLCARWILHVDGNACISCWAPEADLRRVPAFSALARRTPSLPCVQTAPSLRRLRREARRPASPNLCPSRTRTPNRSRPTLPRTPRPSTRDSYRSRQQQAPRNSETDRLHPTPRRNPAGRDDAAPSTGAHHPLSEAQRQESSQSTAGRLGAPKEAPPVAQLLNDGSPARRG